MANNVNHLLEFIYISLIIHARICLCAIVPFGHAPRKPKTSDLQWAMCRCIGPTNLSQLLMGHPVKNRPQCSPPNSSLPSVIIIIDPTALHANPRFFPTIFVVKLFHAHKKSSYLYSTNAIRRHRSHALHNGR